MINIKVLAGFYAIFTIVFTFPLSFTVEKDNPLCFIERFDMGEVILKESNIKL